MKPPPKQLKSLKPVCFVFFFLILNALEKCSYLYYQYFSFSLISKYKANVVYIQADLVQKKTKTINYFLKRQHPTKIANSMYKFQYSRQQQRHIINYPLQFVQWQHQLPPGSQLQCCQGVWLKAPSESKLVFYWRLGISFCKQ